MSKQRSNIAYLISSDNCLDMLNTKNKNKKAKPMNRQHHPKSQVNFEIKGKKEKKITSKFKTMALSRPKIVEG